MKKTVIFIFLISVIIFIPSNLLLAKEKPKPEAKKEAKPQPKIVYEFKNKDELQQFTLLYQRKQLILNRMAVLQTYLNMEMANLDDVNGQLYYKFKMDPQKNYNLDQQGMTLQELPPAETKKPAQE